jgi:segregation and condensation protein B
MPPQNLRSAVEALLFSSDQPLTLVQLAEAVEAEPAAVTEALTALGEEYRSREAGIEVREMAGGWIVTTTTAMNPFVTRMLRGKRKMRLSRAALETLAIIAYKQPVTKTEAEAIRGVDCSGTLATLLERSLVTIKGRSTVVGRPLLYGTTDEFLNYFGLRDITELPRPEELRALVAAREPEQMEMIEVDADGMPLALAEAAAAATAQEAAEERQAEADDTNMALLAAGVAAGVVAAGDIDAAELEELEAALDEASDPDFDDEALAAELAELDAADEDDLDAEEDAEEDDADEAEFSDDDDDEAYEDDDEDEYEDDEDDADDESDDLETTELVEEDELDEYEQEAALVSGDGLEFSDDDEDAEDEDEYDDEDDYDEDDDFEGDDADEDDDDRAAHLSETDGR